MVEPHQEVFAQLHVERHRGPAEFRVRWPVQKPFRPEDLLFFGATLETTLQSLRVATLEQLAAPIHVLEVLSVPSFSMDELVSWLDRAPELDQLEHAKATRAIALVNNNPPLRLQTAAPGSYIQVVLTGPVEHVAVLGHALD